MFLRRSHTLILLASTSLMLFSATSGCVPPTVSKASGGDSDDKSDEDDKESKDGQTGMDTMGLGTGSGGADGNSGTAGVGTGGAGGGVGTGGIGTGGIGTGGVNTGNGNGDSTGAEAECDVGDPTECFELPDGTPIMFPGGSPRGNCRAGQRKCVDGKWSACEGAIAPEKEDNCEMPGDDANCDGDPNGGCDCVEGVDKPRQCGETNEGACDWGEQKCINGKWGECEGDIGPMKEICDGKADEDCDGKKDEEDDSCECINGKKEACEDKSKVGRCRLGERVCTDGKWGSCKSVTKPKRETCKAPKPIGDKLQAWEMDENCDGHFDELVLSGSGPEGCEYYMLDADGDGYGRWGSDAKDPGVSIQAFENGLVTEACVCEGWAADLKKAGWVLRTRNTQKDCGDCGGALTRAGQEVHQDVPRTEWFALPNACLEAVRKGGIDIDTFDYNCNGQRDWSKPAILIPPRCPSIVSRKEDCRLDAKYGPFYVSNGETIFCGRRYFAAACSLGDKIESDGGADSTGSGPSGERYRCELVKDTSRSEIIRCK